MSVNCRTRRFSLALRHGPDLLDLVIQPQLTRDQAHDQLDQLGQRHAPAVGAVYARQVREIDFLRQGDVPRLCAVRGIDGPVRVFGAIEAQKINRRELRRLLQEDSSPKAPGSARAPPPESD